MNFTSAKSINMTELLFTTIVCCLPVVYNKMAKITKVFWVLWHTTFVRKSIERRSCGAHFANKKGLQQGKFLLVQLCPGQILIKSCTFPQLPSQKVSRNVPSAVWIKNALAF